MYLIELFLPLADNEGEPFDASEHAAVKQLLTDRFGGVTAYPRAPASGRWKVSSAEKQHDDLVVYEVMAEAFDEQWWRDYRQSLEEQFRQEKILVRALKVQLL